MTRSGPVATITLSGELDMSGREALTALLLTEVQRPGTTAICIDMSAVGFLASAGMEPLLEGHRAAQAIGHRFTLTGLNGAPLRALQITGVLEVLNGTP